MESGTRAAAAGGYTTVFAMANTTPVADSVEVVERVVGSAASTNCEVRPVGALTKGLEGRELADIRGMASSRAQVTWFSDDGHCLSDSALMREALIMVRDVDGTLAQHAQDPNLTRGAQINDGAAMAKKLDLPGWPPMAEEVIIARDAIMAHHLGSRVHVCHVSTEGSMEVVRWAKEQGFPITAEVAPHHLTLTDESAGEDPAFKVNPPLRSARDVAAVTKGLMDGVIDVVATDHAPHPDSEKGRCWSAAPMGMLGLETALPIMSEFVAAGTLSWSQLADRMCRTPARLGKLDDDRRNPGGPGKPATFCLIDPNDPWTLRAENLQSRGHNTPYDRRRFPARVMFTAREGRGVFDELAKRGSVRGGPR